MITLDRRSRKPRDRDWLVIHAEVSLLIGILALIAGIGTVVFLWIAALS